MTTSEGEGGKKLREKKKKFISITRFTYVGYTCWVRLNEF